jgi:hypothetical protein
MAPGVADEVVARRTTAAGDASLWTWVWSRLAPVGRRIDPRETVLTKRYVYARTRRGERLRVPIDTLRTAWRTESGDAVYVFGRHTELLLVRQDGCALDAALHERVPSAGRTGPAPADTVSARKRSSSMHIRASSAVTLRAVSRVA